MKSSVNEIEAIIGTEMGGGYYAGRIMIEGQAYALILAPKEHGDHDDIEWIEDYKDVPNAKSYNDGLANTKAMAEAGSELALWAQGLNIGGNSDWYIPSLDELEIIYRNLKPITCENSCYARSGINLSAIVPTQPYTPEFPLQTKAELFQSGGAQAMEEEYYWASTQHASDSVCAWFQNFDYGCQDTFYKDYDNRARAVRRLPI